MFSRDYRADRAPTVGCGFDSWAQGRQGGACMASLWLHGFSYSSNIYVCVWLYFFLFIFIFGILCCPFCRETGWMNQDCLWPPTPTVSFIWSHVEQQQICVEFYLFYLDPHSLIYSNTRQLFFLGSDQYKATKSQNQYITKVQDGIQYGHMVFLQLFFLFFF